MSREKQHYSWWGYIKAIIREYPGRCNADLSGVAQHERDRIMARFPQAVQLKGSDTIAAWNRGEIPLLLGHPAGVGHGLNLQDGGHIVVWYGPTYDLELDEQFNDRLYRQGQQFTTSIIYLVAEGTVEQDAMAALRAKADGQNAMMAAIRARVRKYKGTEV